MHIINTVTEGAIRYQAMAALWKFVRSSFWAESVWLPPQFTWEDLANHDDGIYKAQLSDMLLTLLPMTLFMLVLRVCFERYIASPIGQYLGLKQREVRKAPPNLYLEKVFSKNETPDKTAIESCSKQTDLSVRQIERWFRTRRTQNRTITLYRFTETSWRCFYFSFIFCYGVVVLWDKSWLWDTKESWRGYPNQHVSQGVYWYYAIAASFFIALLITQCWDVKRTDFKQMAMHHVATLALLFVSWSHNYYRSGSTCLLLHDAIGPWLEGVKLAKYVKYEKLTDGLFVVFLLVWTVTRMILFPTRIVYSFFVESIDILGFSTIYYFYAVLVGTLQVLHVLWYITILRVAYTAFFKNGGQGVKDIRSGSDEDVSDDNISKNKAKKIK